MLDANLYSLLADAILVVHFAFVAFVVGGFLLILIGLLANWSWIHKPVFRLTHLATIGVVILQAWFEQICPLTLWENELRRRAGQPTYSETFIEHWLHKVLYYQAEPWVFTALYTGFGALVAVTWVLGRRNSKH